MYEGRTGAQRCPAGMSQGGSSGVAKRAPAAGKAAHVIGLRRRARNTSILYSTSCTSLFGSWRVPTLSAFPSRPGFAELSAARLPAGAVCPLCCRVILKSLGRCARVGYYLTCVAGSCAEAAISANRVRDGGAPGPARVPLVGVARKAAGISSFRTAYGGFVATCVVGRYL